MVSFFRRKKPPTGPGTSPDTDSTRRFSVEELAAAFPEPARQEEPNSGQIAPVTAESNAAAASAPVQVVDLIVAAAPSVIVDNSPAPATPGKSGWRERLRDSGFARGLGGLFSRNPKLDDDLLDEIETALLTADVGVPATTALVEDLRKRMKAREFADANALLKALRTELIAMLEAVALPLRIDASAKPFVVLTSASTAWARPPPSASSRAVSRNKGTA